MLLFGFFVILFIFYNLFLFVIYALAFVVFLIIKLFQVPKMVRETLEPYRQISWSDDEDL